MASFSASVSVSASVKKLKAKGFINAKGKVTAKGKAKAKAVRKQKVIVDAFWAAMQKAIAQLGGNFAFQASTSKTSRALPRIAIKLPKNAIRKGPRINLGKLPAPRRKAAAKILLNAKLIRSLILRAKAGHKPSMKIVLDISQRAKAGDPKASEQFGSAMAICHGLANGTVSPATPEEAEDIEQWCDEDEGDEYEDEEDADEDDGEYEDEDECCACS
jgi:hypothetical protein